MFNFPSRIEDEGTVLSEIRLTDMKRLAEWHQDLDIQRFTKVDDKMNLQDLIMWYQADYVRSPEKFFIIDGDAGYCQVYFQTEDKAELGMSLNKENRKKGLAYKALKMLSETCFIYGFRKLKARIMTDNVNALKLVEKVGFKQEGILRNEEYKNGTYVDLALFSLFKHELT